jgi:hypothetical protein
MHLICSGIKAEIKSNNLMSSSTYDEKLRTIIKKLTQPHDPPLAHDSYESAKLPRDQKFLDYLQSKKDFLALFGLRIETDNESYFRIRNKNGRKLRIDEDTDWMFDFPKWS